MSVGDRLTFRRKERRDSATGRTWTQLTSGKGYTYPLYFFGQVVAGDGKTLVFYRWEDGEVQNWKLDLEGEEAVQLTAAKTKNCLWRFWDESEKCFGVREQLSAMSPGTDELLYFNENELRAVHLHTLADRLVYELPGDRVPCGLPGASPDGKHFALLHVDRAWWDEKSALGVPPRHEAKRCHLDLVDLHAGTARPLVVMNSWMTHANFYDNNKILFCHPPSESAILLTDLRGGWYAHVRTQKPEGLQATHYVATARGIFFETASPGPDSGMMGMIDPDTYDVREYRTNLPVSHCGVDPEGKLWFGHVYRMKPTVESYLAYLPSCKPDRVNPLVLLTEGINCYGRGQKSHLHPVLLPDRKRIIFTGPDHTTKTNHVFLLDVADLANIETTF